MMSLNEKSFYTSFTRREAPEQSTKFFTQSKKLAVDQFMKLKVRTKVVPQKRINEFTGGEHTTSIAKRDQRLDKRILEQLRYEDEVELERPAFKTKEVDLRKIKLTKTPIGS